MERMNRLNNTSRASLGKRLCYFAIILCLMVPFLIGVLIFVLGCIPILCVSPVLYMGLKLAQVSLRFLRDMVSALKGTRYSTQSVNGVEILNPKT